MCESKFYNDIKTRLAEIEKQLAEDNISDAEKESKLSEKKQLKEILESLNS